MTHAEAADLSESAVEALRKAKQAPDFGKVLAEIRKVQAEAEPEFYLLSGISQISIYSTRFACSVLDVRAYPDGKARHSKKPFGAGMKEALELALRIVDALNAGRV